MSRTTIIPTVQTKANQATDLYLRADQNATISGNLTVNGDIIMNDIGDELICKVQGTVGGEGCILFNQVADNSARWAIGTQAVETGANSGNNLRIFSYADNGAFLAAPLQINRASSQVTMPAACAVGTTLAVGLQTGAGTIQVIGPNGASQVYDEVYNPPNAGNDFLMFTAGTDGITGGSFNNFIPTKSGTYILSLTVQAYAAGFTWTQGACSLLYAVTYNAGGNVVAGSQIYVPALVNPNGMPAIGPLAANTVEYQQDILIQLTAGETYEIGCGSTGVINLGAGGNVAIVVQKLID
jgi:hypothetical protein